MTKIHQFIENLPKLRGNLFYHCASCTHGKMQRRSFNTNTRHTISAHPNAQPLLQFSEIVCLDYGFLCGSSFAMQDKSSGRLITSLDGYCCYLLIEDLATCYTFVFPMTTMQPPTEVIKRFLAHHGNQTSQL